jgi:hypothetical protein
MAENEGEATLPGEAEKRRRKLPPMAIWNAGRMLGQLKRRNPQIVEEINEYAKATGMTPTQILEEAITHYIVRRRIAQSNLTVEQIYDAWMLLREMQKTALDIWREWAGYVFSEEYMSMLEMRQEWIKQAMEEMPPPSKPVLPPRKIEELERKFLEKFDPIIDWLLDWTVDSLVKAIAGYGVKPPPTLKRKIPVTVIYEEEEKIKEEAS